MRGVKQVEVLSGFNVRLTFTDGTTRVIDLDFYLRGPVFEPIRSEPGVFGKVRVDPEAAQSSGRMALTSILTFCTSGLTQHGWRLKKSC